MGSALMAFFVAGVLFGVLVASGVVYIIMQKQKEDLMLVLTAVGGLLELGEEWWKDGDPYEKIRRSPHYHVHHTSPINAYPDPIIGDSY